MSAVKMIAVFTENKAGEVARIARIIAEAGANIRWITIATNDGCGVLKLLVDKCDLALQSLKQKGLVVNFLQALAIEVKDKPGSLQAVCECLAKAGINLENTSGFVANNRAVLVLEVQDTAAAAAVLQKQGMRVLTQEEILSL